MINKRKAHHRLKVIKNIKPLYLLIVAVFFLTLGIIGLRQNNLQMAELREKVMLADEKAKDIETPLRELRQYVHSHMNTELSSGNVSIKPPIQLKNRYERLVKQEQERVERVNRQVKKDAERQCASRFPSGGLNPDRINCVAEYTRQHAIEARSIPSELYKFDFVSPGWSPDLAGWGLLGALTFFALFVVRLVAGWWYKKEL